MIDRIALVRQALASLQQVQGPQRPGMAAHAASWNVAAPAGTQAFATARSAQFERRVRQRIAQLGADDPHRRQRALRIVVEIALLSEFGERVGADPAFHSMIDQVTATMNDDADLRTGVDRLLKDLA